MCITAACYYFQQFTGTVRLSVISFVICWKASSLGARRLYVLWVVWVKAPFPVCVEALKQIGNFADEGFLEIVALLL